MASLLLAVTVAALALEPAAAASRAATGGVVAAPLQAAALSRLGQSASCDECVLIVSVVQNITENATTLAEVIAAFDDACDLIYPPGDNRTLCLDIGAAAGALLPFLDKQLQTLAWDIPQVFCSTVLPLCTVSCCNSTDGTSYAPEQVHLAFNSSDLTELRVTWVTLNATTTSTVRFGPRGGALTSSVAGTAWTYTYGGWIGVIHSAVMTGLARGAAYSYQVGDAAGGWSRVFNTTTLPADVGSAANPLRVVQIADMGYASKSDDTVAALTRVAATGGAHFVLHPGDESYADGEQSHWDVYMRKIEPIAATLPYFHARFPMPSANRSASDVLAGGAPGGAPYYSLDIGEFLHLTAMNTETIIDTADIEDAEVAWLDADLAAHPSPALWRVTAGHRPMYCSNNHGNGSDCGTFASILRYQAEASFNKRKVDLSIAAHMHGYQRSWPLATGGVITQHGYANPTAPVYVINGAAGNREGNEKPDPIAWSAFETDAYGYGMLTIAGPSLLSFQFVRSSDGAVLDSWNITRG